MEPSLLQLVDIGQNQGVISTISVSDCWNWNWQFQFWWLSVLTTFSFDHLQFWPPSVFTTFNFDHFQFWPPSILATFSFDQFWPLSVLTATPPPWRPTVMEGWWAVTVHLSALQPAFWKPLPVAAVEENTKWPKLFLHQNVITKWPKLFFHQNIIKVTIRDIINKR
jgi:hypothetical protein